jgi:hypothetical protein
LGKVENLIMIDRLALEAREGCEKAVDKLCRYYLPEIEKISKAIWYRVSNEAAFECNCILEIKNALKRFDRDKGHFDFLVRRMIKKAARKSVARGSKKRDNITSLDKMVKDKDDSQEDGLKTFDIPDNVIIEDSLITKEIVSNLAEGDERKEYILTCWSEGIYNETNISELLAQRFGGNARSHCKYLQRFREKCKIRLAIGN